MECRWRECLWSKPKHSPAERVVQSPRQMSMQLAIQDKAHITEASPVLGFSIDKVWCTLKEVLAIFFIGISNVYKCDIIWTENENSIACFLPEKWRSKSVQSVVGHALNTFWTSISLGLKTLSSFEFFLACSMQFWMVFRILPLKMDLIQEFSIYLHFEIAPCLFERIARQSCAFCNRRKDLVAMLEEQLQIK